jgi:hypothetical protein
LHFNLIHSKSFHAHLENNLFKRLDDLNWIGYNGLKKIIIEKGQQANFISNFINNQFEFDKIHSFIDSFRKYIKNENLRKFI